MKLIMITRYANQIYYDVDFYNLSRLKKLQNIKLTYQNKEEDFNFLVIKSLIFLIIK